MEMMILMMVFHKITQRILIIFLNKKRVSFNHLQIDLNNNSQIGKKIVIQI